MYCLTALQWWKHARACGVSMVCVVRRGRKRGKIREEEFVSVAILFAYVCVFSLCICIDIVMFMCVYVCVFVHVSVSVHVVRVRVMSVREVRQRGERSGGRGRTEEKEMKRSLADTQNAHVNRHT
eukprot:GHVS01100615.1.p2 GENE.GHVS01100615.1~~GHVS01100615.1.p2  ORF type:complete len:125 (+),score=23.63 GHVS01100615.1:305-679(+)